MAPEQEARERAFYDHESTEPRRRHRAAADWGVGEDIFDRMPSRFNRVERRAEHREVGAATAVVEREDTRGRDEGRRFERSETGEWARVEADERASGRGERARRETGEWARVEADERASGRGERARRETGESARVEADERAGARGEREAGARGERGEAGRDERAAGGGARGEAGRGERAVGLNTRGEAELDPRAAARAVMSWGADLDDEAAPLVPGESRTIVLSRDEDEPSDGTPRRITAEFDALPAEPQERKTVVISGHPDRMPVARQQRPPRTAVERIGHRPDRIVAYAVALGFLLVLIAVLTTGQ